MIETSGQNNTLAPFENCVNANNAINSFGSVQSNAWAEVYLAPTLKRLSPLLKGFNLTTTDLIAMQQLCAYEVRCINIYSISYCWLLQTVSLGFSAFCDVFTEDEWKGFEYFVGELCSLTIRFLFSIILLDLSFWYANGPGNPASSAQGIGYVQELVSRLTQTHITSFNSAVNSSIVTDPVQFPLNQSIFVDATHDTVVAMSQPSSEITQFNKTNLFISHCCDESDQPCRQWASTNHSHSEGPGPSFYSWVWYPRLLTRNWKFRPISSTKSHHLRRTSWVKSSRARHQKSQPTSGGYWTTLLFRSRGSKAASLTLTGYAIWRLSSPVCSSASKKSISRLTALQIILYPHPTILSTANFRRIWGNNCLP